MKRGIIGGIAALVAVLAFSGAAEAHTIKLGKARAASERDARALCLEDPECFGWLVQSCARRSAHVARCRVYIGGEFIKTGSPWECTWIDQWKIKKRTRQRLYWSFAVFDATLQCYEPLARTNLRAPNRLEERVLSARFRDRDCSDFRNRRHAQRFFRKHNPRRDPHGLDADNDGKACEDSF